MEVKEEKLMEEEQRVPEKTIPVFTVLKNGAILKNIFVVNSRDFSSPERNGSMVSGDDDEVEETLVVGRHPDCDILLTHPSISRFHLEIRSISSRQRLFLTDLSSVHGTWVRDLRVEPHACVEVEEGDTIRIGGSTRIYRLHWIPLSRAYDFDNPFVSPLDASMVMEQEEENRMIEAENLEVAQHQSLVNNGLNDDGDLHLDVTSEGTGSSVPSEDEDTYVTTREMSLPLASPSVLTLSGDSVKSQKLQLNEDLQTSTKWNLGVVEAAADKPSSSSSPSKQQSGGYLEGLGFSDLLVAAEADKCNVREHGGLHLNVMSERMEPSVPNEEEDPFLAAKETLSLQLPIDSINSEIQWLTEDVQASPELSISSVEVNAEIPSSGCSPSKGKIDDCFEVSSCSAPELTIKVEILSLHPEVSEETELVTKEVMEASAKPLSKTDNMSHEENRETEVSRQVIAVSPNSFSQAGPPLEILTEAQGLVGSEFMGEVSVETEIENPLHQKSIGETKAEIWSHGAYDETEVSTQGITVAPSSFSQAEPTLEILTDDAPGLLGSEVLSEVAVDTEIENLLHQKSNGETKADIQSHKDNGESEVSRQVIAVSTKSFSQAEPTLEILTGPPLEILTEAQGLVGSEFMGEVSVETEIENPLHQKSIGETKAEIWSHGAYDETEVSTQGITVAPSSFSQAEPTLEILTDDAPGLLGSEVLSEVAVDTEIENLLHQKSNGETKADIQSHKDNGESEVSRQVIAVSTKSFSQAEPTLEILSEEARGLEVQSEVAIETETENVLHQTSNGEAKVGSRQVSAVSDFSAGDECLSRINTEDIQSLCSSWQPMPESEVEIWSDANSAGHQNKKSGMTRETEQIFDEGSSSCLSEVQRSNTQIFLSTPNQKYKPELSIGSGRSEKYYSLSEIKGEESTDKWCPILSTLAAETFGDTKPIKELPSDDTGSQENQTPQTYTVRDDVLSEMDSSSTCNIWSRRGKAASVLQIRTNKSEGKQTGRQPKDKLHRRQALSDKSISLTGHHGGENLEPEIFTPDKENLTPSSHMLKRLQDIGDVKDSKSSSKLSGRSCSSLVHSNIAIVASEAFAEPEIFTPDKENLTPNSHMLKRLREFGDIKGTKEGSSSKATRKPFFDHLEANVMAEQKPEDLQSMSSKSKVKHEPVALKKKAERVPFQPLLDKSSSQSQSYTEASTASARHNNSRGIRSSSVLSDGKSKMKWTIVLDTSSLLDKESRKPLHLLQGLKGTHLVVPRTVLRELDEVKGSRSLLFRRRTEMASSALDWIEECEVNSKWWIQVQSPSEETKATAPTPPVTPQSNGSLAFPFSLHWNTYAPEIDSPTSEDQVLECALLYRYRDRDEKLVLLSNDATLKIKAMAEGVICETPHEFYESLVNPFSERFMWTESTPRGRTWSHLDDDVLRERYNNRACRSKSTYNGGGRGESGAAAKGLKLILLHNSHYGHTH
ncbi:PREDICTED: FHA domain-containing protein PS1-like [Camelina sativa]|uniref:FHA domain-containing protein PS1-like n=1 Tax=Camelina sativa TaxID=90675 RepID=A0ABM1RK32_CAMSA|nr:PREDICTED: FHA domain-containing protein PS1-like [Camelina sativa]